MTTTQAYFMHQFPHDLPTSLSSQLNSLLDNLLSSKTTPAASASATATLIQSQPNISLALSKLIGLFFSAAESSTSVEKLNLLASYLVELANIPDAVNQGPEAKMWDAGGGEMHRIEVGETIVLDGKKLWSELPMCEWNVTERFQGPELYTHNLVHPSPHSFATAKWKSINTLLALISHNPAAQSIPALAGYYKLSRVTLAMALEYSPRTRLGKNTAMHVPAAAAWFSLAEEEVERMCEVGTEKMGAGDLWVERGGSEDVDGERLGFWRERIGEVGGK